MVTVSRGHREPFPQMDAAGRVGIGVALKLLLHFSARVVPEKLHGIICSDCVIPEFWFRDLPSAGEGPTCLAVGYLMGPAGERARALGEAATIAAALAQLNEIFPAEFGRGHLIKGALHDWATEPYIQMAYTHCVTGEKEALFRELAKPLPNGRVMFAGEAYCSEGANMSVHCALEAGHRAAREAAAFLANRPGDLKDRAQGAGRARL